MKKYRLVIQYMYVIGLSVILIGCSSNSYQNKTVVTTGTQKKETSSKGLIANQERATKAPEKKKQSSVKNKKSGRLEIKLDFKRSSTPASNQYAIWIENSKGEVVKNIYVSSFTANGGYKVREDSVPTWVAHAKPSEMEEKEIDAISGATPRTGQQSYYWDGTDENGEVIQDGKYIFYVEGTMYWSSIVLYSGTFEIGTSSKNEIEVKASYTESTETNRNMIQSVKAKYIVE